MLPPPIHACLLCPLTRSEPQLTCGHSCSQRGALLRVPPQGLQLWQESWTEMGLVSKQKGMQV